MNVQSQVIYRRLCIPQNIIENKESHITFLSQLRCHTQCIAY